MNNKNVAQKAKDTFMQESGFASSSPLTGLFLTFDGASTSDQSSGAVVIH